MNLHHAPEAQPETLTELFSGDAPLNDGSVIYEGRTILAKSLQLESQKVAQAFADLGVRRGDRVAIWLPNCPAWLACFFACARLGAIAVAINTRFRSAELEDIVGRSGARILVFWPEYREIDFAGIIRGLSPQALSNLETLIAYDESSSAPVLGPIHGRQVISYRELLRKDPHILSHANAADGCVIFPTSGTTRAPKFVLHSHASISVHAKDIARSFDFSGEGACSLLIIPMCGVFGFCLALATLAAGRPLVMMASFDVERASGLIRAHSVTHLGAVGDIVARLLGSSMDPIPFPSVRIVVGARAGQAAPAGARGLVLVGTYGSSELQAMLSRQEQQASAGQRELGGGMLLAQGASVRVRDPDTGEILPHGAQGQLEFWVPSQMLGYFNNPEATREAFTTDGFFRSGDLGYTVADRTFVFLARMGDALRLSGFLVNPEEIEAFIGDHPAVVSAQVVGIDYRGRVAPVAFVRLSKLAVFDEREILAHCESRMARYKVPMRVFPVDEFPVTQGANGDKVQKARLRDLARTLLA